MNDLPADHQISLSKKHNFKKFFLAHEKLFAINGLLIFFFLGFVGSDIRSFSRVAMTYPHVVSAKTVLSASTYKILTTTPTIAPTPTSTIIPKNAVAKQLLQKNPPSSTISPTQSLKQSNPSTPPLQPTTTPTPIIQQTGNQSPTQTPPSTPSNNIQTTSTDSAVNQLLSLINTARSQHGASALRLDGTLSSCALAHSKQMSSQNNLFHDLQNDVCDNSTAKAENIGYSTEQPTAAVTTVHTSMMAEGPGGGHYENIINPIYNHIGIGIYLDGHTTWITEDFGRN